MRTHGRRSGFTLIELLTVIGIIAVLAAILFPVFSQARAKARQARCLSHLQQIGVAIESYVQDHHGFLPTWSITHPGTAPWQPPSGDENQPADHIATWDISIMTYLKQDELLICPDNPVDETRVARSYAISQYTQRPMRNPNAPSNWISIGGYKDDIPLPGEAVLLFEKGKNPPGAWGDALGQNVYQYHTDDMPDDGKGYEEPQEFPMWHSGGKNFLYLDYHAKWAKNTSGPFAHKPRADATVGTCEKWGKPEDGGDWPTP
ncbi:MAG: type II secretion system protein [Armatimonadota bacterium]